MWGKVMSSAAFNIQKSWKKLQPVAEETTDSRDRRHRYVQAQHFWTDKATQDTCQDTCPVNSRLWNRSWKRVRSATNKKKKAAVLSSADM